MNNGYTAIAVISILILAGVILYKLWERSQYTVEMVQLDENDPEYKRLVEIRNSFLTSIFGHLSINLLIDSQTINDTCEIVNLDEKRTIVKFSSDDTICTMVIYWDKSIKLTLFNNRKLRGKMTQMSKIFRIKDNEISAKALTKFIIKFRKKAYGEDKANIEELEESCLQVAKEFAEKMDVAELKKRFVDAILESGLEDYKTPKDGVKEFTWIYAIALKFCREELLEALRGEKKDEKEPE